MQPLIDLFKQGLVPILLVCDELFTTAAQKAEGHILEATAFKSTAHIWV